MLRILVIEDDVQLLKMVVTFLKELHYNVDSTDNVKQAFEYMGKKGYDIIITDKNLEGLNGSLEGGMDILRHVNQNYKTTEVIMMTGYASIETAIQAMKLGAFDYIKKPFKIKELQDKISRILEYKELLKAEGSLFTYKTLHNEILELLQKEKALNNDELQDFLISLDGKIDEFFQAQKKWSLSWYNVKRE
ncbi:response regulator [candidate division KSB1 bacterium]|nr:response regulator [candidate division KSB1 bacterium]